MMYPGNSGGCGQGLRDNSQDHAQLSVGQHSGRKGESVLQRAKGEEIC